MFNVPHDIYFTKPEKYICRQLQKVTGRNLSNEGHFNRIYNTSIYRDLHSYVQIINRCFVDTRDNATALRHVLQSRAFYYRDEAICRNLRR